jgi:hypothetical protein
MAPAIFIPPNPSPTDSDESYSFPIITTDPTHPPVLDLALIYFGLRASTQFRQRAQMSSNTSTNPSNAWSIENHVPLPVRPVESPEPPISPNTIANTLAAHPELNADILQAITKGLLATIARRDAHENIEIRRLKEQIVGLHDRVEHYENIFEKAPDGYIENEGQVPHFYIPLGDGVFKPAKWIKKLEDGHIAGFHADQGLNESPYIIDLYAQADTVGHGEENPIEPLPAWFHALLIGPSSDFVHLQCDIGDLDDWGLAREIAHFRELDQEAAELAARVEVLHEELDTTRDARTMSEKRLVLAHASQKAARLENLLKKVSMLSTHSRRKNDSRRGRLV